MTTTETLLTAPTSHLTSDDLAEANQILTASLDANPAAFPFDSRLRRLSVISAEQHRRSQQCNAEVSNGNIDDPDYAYCGHAAGHAGLHGDFHL